MISNPISWHWICFPSQSQINDVPSLHAVSLFLRPTNSYLIDFKHTVMLRKPFFAKSSNFSSIIDSFLLFHVLSTFYETLSRVYAKFLKKEEEDEKHFNYLSKLMRQKSINRIIAIIDIKSCVRRCLKIHIKYIKLLIIWRRKFATLLSHSI